MNVSQSVEEPADGLGEMAAGENAQDFVDVEAVRADAPEVEAGVAGRVELLIGAGHGWQGDDLMRTGNETYEFFDKYLKPSKN